MEKFDGTEQEIAEVQDSDCVVRFAGDCDRWAFHFDWLEPMRSWVPEGYSVVEIAVPDAMREAIGEGNALVWKPPKLGMNYLCPTTSHVRCATEDFSKCYPTATYTTPPAPKYREPTQADVGKMVEVSDIKACLNEAAIFWIEAELLAVLTKDVPARFVAYRLDPGFWKYARIKIEEVR
jgi:hypothetical protein